MEILIKTADWKDPREINYLEEAANLVYESNPEFYDLFSTDKSAICKSLVGQLKDNSSELGYSIILIIEGKLGGVSVYYPSEELKHRRIISLRHMMNIQSPSPNMNEKVKSFAQDVEPITLSRYMYWARLGVAKEYRRQGIASLVNTAMEYDVKHKGYDYICSHLNRNNAISMKMHVGREFSRMSDKEYLFVAMSKKVS